MSFFFQMSINSFKNRVVENHQTVMEVDWIRIENQLLRKIKQIKDLDLAVSIMEVERRVPRLVSYLFKVCIFNLKTVNRKCYSIYPNLYVFLKLYALVNSNQ